MKLDELKKLFTFGNHKLSKRIVIFSISNYDKCASRLKGLCQDEDICYGKCAVYKWKNAVKKQARCLKYWTDTISNFIIYDIIKLNQHRRKNNKIKYFRFNEISDFRNVNDIKRLDYIAKELKLLAGIITYTYTHRKDLADKGYFKNVNFIVRGSGFKINDLQTRIYRPNNKKNNSYEYIGKRKIIYTKSIKLEKNEVLCRGYKKDIICGENCHHCMQDKKNIVFIEHGGNKKFKIID